MDDQKIQVPYTQPRELAARIAGQPLRLITKPGFPGWERVSAAQELLAERAEVAAGARVCLIGCGHGAPAVALERRSPGLRCALLDASVVALAMAERTLAAGGVRGASLLPGVSALPEGAGAFDAVLLEAPQSRQLARRWLVEAHALLRPGGQLFVAGANENGIQSIIADAGALFGGAAPLGYGGKARIASAVRQESAGAPAWAAEPGVAPGTWVELELDVGGERLALRSLPGVFSHNRLDDGTRLLLEAMPQVRGARVLDVGCGYGVIGIVAARRGASAVDMVDSSLLAVAAARASLRLHDIAGANALASDVLQAVARQRYDVVLSNPPFHAGRAVDYDVAHEVIEQARPLLGPGGRLVLVANRFIRYEKVMQGLFERVETLAHTRSYQVLAGTVE